MNLSVLVNRRWNDSHAFRTVCHIDFHTTPVGFDIEKCVPRVVSVFFLLFFNDFLLA